jgi:hypothetical protein
MRDRHKLCTISCNPRCSITLNKLTAGERPTTSGFTHQYSVHRITVWEGRAQHTYTTQNDNQFSFPTNARTKSLYFCLFVYFL